MMTTAELIAWARKEADDRARWDCNGMVEGCDPTISKLRVIAGWLETLDKDRARLTYLDTRSDLLLSFDEGDPDVGVFSSWFADKPTGERGANGCPVVETQAMNGSIRGLIDDLMAPADKERAAQEAESQRPARPPS